MPRGTGKYLGRTYSRLLKILVRLSENQDEAKNHHEVITLGGDDLLRMRGECSMLLS